MAINVVIAGAVAILISWGLYARKRDPALGAGNFGFGISEYIDLPQAKYDPKLGIRGLDVLVSLEKPGYRVKRRKRKKAVVGKSQLVSREEAMAFLREKFGVEVQ